jgi:hypothetical protein
MLESRVICTYDNQDKIAMDHETKSLLNKIEAKRIRGDSIIYPNQELCSLDIVEYLRNRKIISIMVLALTQSGKTGAMSAIIKNYLECPGPENILPIKNIFIITGLSDVEWKDQTKLRLPDDLVDRVFHRNQLTTKFIKAIKNMKNVLIIIDEIQIAAQKDQTLHKVYSQAGFYDKQFLLENDIKIVEFSATPDGTLYDLLKWGDNARVVKMEPGEGYVSCFNLLDSGRVRQYKDLCCSGKKGGIIVIDTKKAHTNIKEIQDLIKETYNTAKYHIIRTPIGIGSDIVIDNFKKIFGDEFEYSKYDKDNKHSNINNILENKPGVDTFIFIKEKVRCSKTLNKDYIGIVYDRYTKSIDDAVVIQGLIGRGTGYDDNGTSIFFTNIESITKYKELWYSSFGNTQVKWNSKTTKYKFNELVSSGTYVDPNFIDGAPDDSIIANKAIEPKFTKFIADRQYGNSERQQEYIKGIQQKAKEFCKKNLKAHRAPNIIKPNKDGFYESTIDGKKRVYSCDDIEYISQHGLGLYSGSTYRHYACYTDITDISTLQFWVAYCSNISLVT